jgi:hypothetical protein
MRQIGIYRAGVSPLHPTRNPFEKGFLDFLKLLKTYIGKVFLNIFLKFLKFQETSFKKFLGGVQGQRPCPINPNLKTD